MSVIISAPRRSTGAVGLRADNPREPFILRLLSLSWTRAHIYVLPSSFGQHVMTRFFPHTAWISVSSKNEGSVSSNLDMPEFTFPRSKWLQLHTSYLRTKHATNQIISDHKLQALFKPYRSSNFWASDMLKFKVYDHPCVTFFRISSAAQNLAVFQNSWNRLLKRDGLSIS